MGCAAGGTAGEAAGWFGADDFAELRFAKDAASITCVRCGGGFACDAAGAYDPGGDDAGRGPIPDGFGMLGISCVPGAFLEADGDAPAAGGGGLVPVPGRGAEAGPLGALGGRRSPAAFWKAPRCESALLTARGDTGGAGAVASSGPGTPGALGTEGGLDVVAGGGPYGAPVARDEGDAVAANGFTGGEPGAIGGPYAVDGTLIWGAGAGELAGPLAPGASARLRDEGSVGAPHAAQNFREPMSSAPHFAQFVIFSIPS